VLSLADERRHRAAGAETWWFGAWRAGAGVFAQLSVQHGRAWYWSVVVRRGEPLLRVVDCDIDLPRVGLELRTSGLWADHMCESPGEQWTVANECYADALDQIGDPYGTPSPYALDLEWYAAELPSWDGDGYRQSGTADGVIELGSGRSLLIDGWKADRGHGWHADAVDLTIVGRDRALPIDALIHTPAGVVQLGLSDSGWGSRLV
jgi:hypothetical protein